MSVPEQGNGSDVAVDAFGVKANVRNVKSLNTGVCLAILLVVSITAVYGYSHVSETKDSGKELAGALKEMAQAIREGNCINSYPEAERENKIDHCKRITR